MASKDDMKAAFEAARLTDRSFESWYGDYAYCHDCGDHVLHEHLHSCRMRGRNSTTHYRDNIITHRTDASVPGSKLVITDLHLSEEAKAALTINIRPDNISRLRHIWQKDVNSTIWKVVLTATLSTLLYIFILLIQRR